MGGPGPAPPEVVVVVSCGPTSATHIGAAPLFATLTDLSPRGGEAFRSGDSGCYPDVGERHRGEDRTVPHDNLHRLMKWTSPSTYRLSRGRRIVLVSIPVAYVVLGVFHPTEHPSVGDPTGLWPGLHLVQLPRIAAVGWMLWTLVGGLQNLGARIVRAPVLPYVVLYLTIDSVLGLAGGFVARNAGRLVIAGQPAAQRLLDQLLQPTPAGLTLYFGSGILLWAVVAATILAHQHAPPVCRSLLGAGGLLFVAGHAPPFGPPAIGLIAAAVAMLTRTAPAAGRGRRAVSGPLPDLGDERPVVR